jgi:hypothetical protein
MSPRRRKAEDAEVLAATVRVMPRVGPAALAHGVSESETRIATAFQVLR